MTKPNHSTQVHLPPPHDKLDDLWQATLNELRRQIPKATFNAWLSSSYLLSSPSRSSFWVIVLRNGYAWEWVTYRLSPVVVRTVAGIVEDKVDVCFVSTTIRRNRGETSRSLPLRLSCVECMQTFNLPAQWRERPFKQETIY